MNISGIRPSHGFYSYNTIKINQLRNQQIAAAKLNDIKVVVEKTQWIPLHIRLKILPYKYYIDKGK